MGTTHDKDKAKADAEKKVSSDAGQGASGNLGEDGDMGTNRSASPDRTSPAVSARDTNQDKPKKTQR